MTGWREMEADQNMRLANKMLEQQAEINKLKAELAKVKRERDLAIAHDRQPYPTADVCRG